MFDEVVNERNRLFFLSRHYDVNSSFKPSRQYAETSYYEVLTHNPGLMHNRQQVSKLPCSSVK
jgi:hypothetical protein